MIFVDSPPVGGGGTTLGDGAFVVILGQFLSTREYTQGQRRRGDSHPRACEAAT